MKKRGGIRRKSADMAGDNDKMNVKLRNLSQKTETAKTVLRGENLNSAVAILDRNTSNR